MRARVRVSACACVSVCVCVLHAVLTRFPVLSVLQAGGQCMVW